VVHEAFLVAIKKSKKIFSIPSNKRVPFLDVIVRNMCYSVLRRKKLTDSENEEKITRKETSPEEIAISNIERKHLIQLLNDLPEGQKDVMYLIRLGFTVEEIALSLSISENAVRNRIFHARKAIKKKLDNH
jgi:RNA polymerase sigma factor (sigma-70 family)